MYQEHSNRAGTIWRGRFGAKLVRRGQFKVDNATQSRFVLRSVRDVKYYILRTFYRTNFFFQFTQSNK